MINHHDRFICIDIPRVASQSLYLSLQPHTTCLADELRIPHLEDVRGKAQARERRLDGPTWREYFRFAFVRNPWSRAVSMWQFLEGGQLRDRFLSAGSSLPFVLAYERGAFLRFLRKIPAYLSDDRDGYVHERWHVTPQRRHLVDRRGEIAVDFVGRFERLQADFDVVCRQIGLEERLLIHTHKSHHRFYADFYDQDAEDLVAQIYATDIETFGYSFGAS